MGRSRLSCHFKHTSYNSHTKLTVTVTVTGLTGPKLAEVSFTVAPGEILGITGLPGSGYEQLPYLVTGAQPATVVS